MHQYSARVQRWWAEGWDVLVTPTIAEPPPLLGEYAAQPDNPLWPITRAVVEVAYAIPFNITGQPAISLPLHWSADGLPVGVQLVAAYGREDLQLRWPPSWSRRALGPTAAPGSTPEPPQRHGQPPPPRPTPSARRRGHTPRDRAGVLDRSLGAHLGHVPADNSGTNGPPREAELQDQPGEPPATRDAESAALDFIRQNPQLLAPAAAHVHDR
jgi:hypothetical protein